MAPNASIGPARPGFVSTRALEVMTVVYLAVPSVIFCLTWVKPGLALVLVPVVLTGVGIWLRAATARSAPRSAESPIAHPLKIADALLALLVVTVVCAHLGVGGWGTMSGDTRYRSNSIFWDLVRKPWPVRYAVADFLHVPTLRIQLEREGPDGFVRGILAGARPALAVAYPTNDLLGVTEGTVLWLAGSGPRVVDAIEGGRVWLRGGPLDPERDGFPNTANIEWRTAERTEPLMLVYSVGSMLPPAMLGKALGWDGANHALFLWSVLGIWLGTCWFLILAGPAPRMGLIVLLLFGGLDVLGDALRQSWLQQRVAWPRFDQHIEWWAGYKRFSFQSTIAGIHWSLPHFIPALIAPLLLIHTALHQRRFESLGLLIGLTFLWSPLVFLGLIPVVCGILPVVRWRALLSFPNLVAAPSLAVLLFLFYTKGGGTFPHDWVWRIYGLSTLPVLLLFYVVEFGLLAIVIRPYARTMARTLRHVWLAVLGGLFIAPLYMFGWSSDISMRMSITLLCVFAVFVVRAAWWFWEEARYVRLSALAALLFVGSWTGLIDARLALRDIDYPHLYRTPPVDMSVLDWVYWIPSPELRVLKNLYLSEERTNHLRQFLREARP